jgi:hypothetical protein
MTMAAKRGASAHTGLEHGVCIVCGQTARGFPAQPDLLIKSARKLRGLLKAEKHTVVCKTHLSDALAKRARFEKSRFGYQLMAALFFLFVITGPILFGKIRLEMLVPGIVGAILIMLVSYSQYYPKFAAATS